MSEAIHRHFVVIGPDGRAAAFWPGGPGGPVPGGAIGISEELWAAWTADPVRQRWDWDAEALVSCDPPAAVVLSVLPVAFRQVLASMPPPVGSPVGAEDAEDAVTLAVAAMPKPWRIAWEYCVRVERRDLMELAPGLGWAVEQVDAVLAAAAALPGSDAVWGRA